MGAAKKYRGHYPVEGANASEDKALIEQYVNKIEDLLKKDPSAQKKAAAIVSALINSSNKNKSNKK